MRYTFKVSLPGKHGENYTLVASMSGICMETTESCLHGFLSWETTGWLFPYRESTWKPPGHVSMVSYLGKLTGNHRLFVSMSGIYVETTGVCFHGFLSWETYGKPQVDCFHVGNLCGNHYVVSIKWKLYGNY